MQEQLWKGAARVVVGRRMRTTELCATVAFLFSCHAEQKLSNDT
jgi:hypothetical protein